MVGLSKKMDIFGIAVLGIVTSVGGGIIRDLVLGNTPPATFQNPDYALVAIFVSLIIFIPAVRRFLFKKQSIYEKTMRLMDSIGLGIFTAVGIEIAYLAGHRSVFLLVLRERRKSFFKAVGLAYKFYHKPMQKAIFSFVNSVALWEILC